MRPSIRSVGHRIIRGLTGALAGITLVGMIPLAQAAITITTPSPLPSGQVDIDYEGVTLQATGGTGQLTWSVFSGAFPPGLTLSSASGSIAGKPTQVGKFNFTIFVVDGSFNSSQKPFELTVMPKTLDVTTENLPAGVVAVPYSQTLAATGGFPPYSWGLAGGSMPPGLTLASGSGVISGVPSALPAGVNDSTFSFTVSVVDTNFTTAAKGLSITIVKDPLVIKTA